MKRAYIAVSPSKFLVGRAGLEPATNGLKVRKSLCLSALIFVDVTELISIVIVNVPPLFGFFVDLN